MPKRGIAGFGKVMAIARFEVLFLFLLIKNALLPPVTIT